jgi:hypothetical protein
MPLTLFWLRSSQSDSRRSRSEGAIEHGGARSGRLRDERKVHGGAPLLLHVPSADDRPHREAEGAAVSPRETKSVPYDVLDLERAAHELGLERRELPIHVIDRGGVELVLAPEVVVDGRERDPGRGGDRHVSRHSLAVPWVINQSIE